jgi:hypothetical protein
MDILRVTITGPPTRAAACGIHAAERLRRGIFGSTSQRQTETGGRSIMESIKTIARHVAAALGVTLAMAGGAQAQAPLVGQAFPAGFLTSEIGWDTNTGSRWIGFGGAGPVTRTPVIILHGNDGTPYPVICADGSQGGRYSMNVHGFATFLAGQGWSRGDLWALGWQGDQCDQKGFSSTTGMEQMWVKSANNEHTVGNNVQDLRVFVQRVLAYTGASRVDIVAHGEGVLLAREWVRQDVSRKLVRRFVAIDGPNQGTIICAPLKNGVTNPWALAGFGGFVKGTAYCEELGAPNTTFLQLLNKAADGARISPSDTLVIRAADSSWPYMPGTDGDVTGVSASLDVDGNPVDLTYSASIRGGQQISLTGTHAAGAFPGGLLNKENAHSGVANSSSAWQAALQFLKKK